jgi:hypothetical protein
VLQQRTHKFRLGKAGQTELRSRSSWELVGVGQIRFYSAADIDDLFSSGWKLLSREHLDLVEHASVAPRVHAEWRVVAEKT